MGMDCALQVKRLAQKLGVHPEELVSRWIDEGLARADREQLVDRVASEFARKLGLKHRASAVYLYGSRAKGSWDEWSDYDFVVVSPEFKGILFAERGKELRKLWHDTISDSPVSLLCLTPDEFEKQARGMTFVAEVLKHARKVG